MEPLDARGEHGLLVVDGDDDVDHGRGTGVGPGPGGGERFDESHGGIVAEEG